VSERSLREIALDMRTDKEGVHHYVDAYERHLAHLRHRKVTLLEIGVGGYADPDLGGESLRMWKEFFPQAHIIGVDIHDKARLAEDRITILQGDQSDPAFLHDLAARFGPFDIVVDDGSHICGHVIASFQGLFPHLTDGGIYAIEDLQTSYWARSYGGSSGLDRSGTSMTFLHALTDGLNFAEFDIADYTPTASDLSVKSVTFYHNLAFIERGSNDELSNFLPPHPRDRTHFVVAPAHRPVAGTRSRLRRWIRTTVPKPVRAAVTRPVRSARALVRRRARPPSDRSA
jgi:hypothetical protein